MLSAGFLPRSGVIHRPDTFVWHNRITRTINFRLYKVVRVYYYTSVVGDELQVLEVKQQLSQVGFDSQAEDGNMCGQIVPVVFKKPAKSRKTRNIDIQIVIDIMRFAFTDEIDRVYLASGDGDYIPLIQEVMRRGKQVELLAFSSGLNGSLRHTVDNFYSLDDVFFGNTDGP